MCSPENTENEELLQKLKLHKHTESERNRKGIPFLFNLENIWKLHGLYKISQDI